MKKVISVGLVTFCILLFGHSAQVAEINNDAAPELGKIVIDETGMATVFLTNFIRCRTSFRMLFRLSLTMSLLGCDDLRQELTVKVRLPR